jgi:Animal haem peroxidase
VTAASGYAVYRVGRDHCLAPSRITDAPLGGARYGRMFPDLPPLISDISELEAAGDAGGLCDAAAAARVWTGNGDDAVGAAGWPLFGQLIGHDITADRSPVGPQADVATLRNARSPSLNLEMLYGDGPVGAPYLYDVHDPAKLLTGTDGADLPRNRQGIALIGDPRNDVHLFSAHLHLMLLHSHNGLVDRLRAGGEAEATLFDATRRALTWHYQWIVVHDFLPRLVGGQLVSDVLARGGRFFSPALGRAYLPLEFADAAYRYGHSQIRHTYQLQPGGPTLPLFPALAGFGAITPEHRVDLGQLFDLPGHAPAQRAKQMDATLPESLIRLPQQVTGDVEVDAYRSLAVRDLLRGTATSLPSGESVADVMGVTPLSADQVGTYWAGGTPLWFYILKEAQACGGGDQLGPVGGRIVAEVLIGLLRADPDSHLVVDPSWRPTLPSRDRSFNLTDLVIFAADQQAASR